MSLTANWVIKFDIEKLSVCLDAYVHYLETKNVNQKMRQSKEVPTRQIDSDMTIYHVKKVANVNLKYKRFDMTMNEVDLFEPVYFDEEIHLNEETFFSKSIERSRFFEGLALSDDIHMLRFDPGGGHGTSTFIWKVPGDNEINSSEIFLRDTKIVSSLKSKMLEFHTRTMRKDFQTSYQNIAGVTIPKHVLRSIYTTLTNDATGDQNPDIDGRIRLSVLGSAPNLVVDLRHLNKVRSGDTFKTFFEQLEKEVEDVTAADERRHNIEHVSKYLSVRDLIDEVSKKLPNGTPIPSEATVLLAFVPKNCHANVAKLYTGRINLRFKVQTRQLRSNHQDDHYCSALFKYLKEYAIKNIAECTMVCMDDKSKVDFGEPGMFSQSGVRGKKSLVPVGSTLSCLDHDIQCKDSLTPSVVLDIDFPENITLVLQRTSERYN